jgi:hypothetical protein
MDTRRFSSRMMMIKFSHWIADFQRLYLGKSTQELMRASLSILLSQERISI